MIEYWITISVQVGAQDEEQAREIGKDLVGAVKSQTAWALIDAEVTDIEAVGDADI